MTRPNLDKGLITSLFDLSFKNIITTKIIRILYVLALILLVLLTLLLLLLSFRVSIGLGVLTLFILAPLYFLVSIVYIRVLLEFVMTVFAIQENTGRMVQLMSGGYPAAAPTGSGSYSAAWQPGSGGYSVGEQATQPPQPYYEIGAVVNGYRFDGTQWLPVDQA